MAEPTPTPLSREEQIDLIKLYDNDLLDMIADPMFRGLLGGNGEWNTEAFQPTRTPVPTPILTRYNTLASLRPDTIEGVIADALVGPDPKTPTEIMATLKAIARDPNNAGTGIYEQLMAVMDDPQYSDQEPNFKPVQDLVNQMDKDYWNERLTLESTAGLKQDPTTMEYYTEEPSEAAQRFIDLGLPLPTERYDVNQLGMLPRDAYAAGQQDLQTLGGVERDAMDRLNSILGEGMLPDRAQGPSLRDPSFGEKLDYAQDRIGGYVGDALGTVGNQFLESSGLKQAGSLLRRFLDPIEDDVNDLVRGMGFNRRGVVGSDGKGGIAKPGTISAGRPIDEETMARMVGLPSQPIREPGTPPPVPGETSGGGRWPNFAEMMPDMTRVDNAREAAEKARLAKEAGLDKFISQMRNDYGYDYGYNAGRIFAADQAGRTPLGDVLGGSMQAAGLGSFGQPTRPAPSEDQLVADAFAMYRNLIGKPASSGTTLDSFGPRRKYKTVDPRAKM